MMTFYFSPFERDVDTILFLQGSGGMAKKKTSPTAALILQNQGLGN